MQGKGATCGPGILAGEAEGFVGEKGFGRRRNLKSLSL
jgi:hypothetical protein